MSALASSVFTAAAAVPITSRTLTPLSAAFTSDEARARPPPSAFQSYRAIRM